MTADQIIADARDSHRGPPPTTHPDAAAIRRRIARTLAQASAAQPVRATIELLCNQRGLGWIAGDARLKLVADLYALLLAAHFKIRLEDLCAAYGAGQWEPA